MPDSVRVQMQMAQLPSLLARHSIWLVVGVLWSLSLSLLWLYHNELRLITTIHTPFRFYLPRIESPTTPVVTPDLPYPLDALPSTFNPSGLKTLCASKKWTKDLYYVCDMNGAGTSNVKSSILTCVRYAIESGAGLVLPRIWQRGDDLINGYVTLRHMSYMFDADFFNASLGEACPQMPLLSSTADIWWLDNAASPRLRPKLLMENITGPSPGAGALKDPAGFRIKFDRWISQQERGDDLAPYGHPDTNPVVVRLAFSVFLEWPIQYDPPEMWQNFGRILRPNVAVAEITVQVLAALEARIEEHHAVKGTQPTVHASEHFPKQLDFYGAHLRAEADARFWWGTNATVILENIIQQALRLNKDFIYVATGEVQNYLDLKKRAASYGLTVTSKYELLSPEWIARLAELTFDVAAMVDYQVLTRAAYFYGVAYSSFSFQVAATRALRSPDVSQQVVRGLEGADYLLSGNWPQSQFFSDTTWP